jgi:hypothetical protein
MGLASVTNEPEKAALIEAGADPSEGEEDTVGCHQ